MTGAIALPSSRALRDLIKKSGDAPDTSLADDGEIRAFYRAVGTLRAKPPGEADMVAEAVGLADQVKAEIRKSVAAPRRSARRRRHGLRLTSAGRHISHPWPNAA